MTIWLIRQTKLLRYSCCLNMPEEKLCVEYLYAALMLTDSFSLLPSSLRAALLHSSFIHGSFTEEETEGSCKARVSISNVNNLSTLCPHSVFHLSGTLQASGESKEGSESVTGRIAFLCTLSHRAERLPSPAASCQVEIEMLSLVIWA